MRISKQQRDVKKSVKDFDDMIKELLDEHGNIFFEDIDQDVYIYKPLGRKAYKDIVANPNLNPMDIEDLVCKETILYPEDFNPDEVEAGVPTKLFEKILTNSFLSSTDDMISLLEACKEEVEQLDVQMSIIISEAFPVYEMDEIESWDMIKFCKMYAKAEWKLKSLKGVELNSDVVDFLKSMNGQTGNDISEPKPQSNTKQSPQPTQTSDKKVKVGNREMTMEEYKQYQSFQKMYPDIDWGADAMYTGYETQTVSTVPTPLRVK